jgi:geranylgeranyl diphosphate synthase type I
MIVAGRRARLRDTPHMTATPAIGSDVLGSVSERVDRVLREWLDRCADDLGRIDEHAPLLVHELERLVTAGGKRLRPAFCIWGYRAVVVPGGTGDDEEPIVRSAAAIELLHTMALVHDDLMDAATHRRGVAASAPHLAHRARQLSLPADPDRFGHAAALLVGDLAAVLADRLFLTSGFEADAIVRALAPYHQMRLEMAAGQLLDVAELASEPDAARRAARLKGGSYTVVGPLQVGAALAGDRADAREALRAYGEPLGEAFQLRDDLHDRDGAHGATRETVNDLVVASRRALGEAGASLDADAVASLDALAALVAMG